MDAQGGGRRVRFARPVGEQEGNDKGGGGRNEAVGALKHVQDHDQVVVEAAKVEQNDDDDDNNRNDEVDGEQVRTDIIQPLLKPASEMTIAEKAKIWYPSSDLKLFRQSSSYLARSIALGDQNNRKDRLNYTNVLSRVYGSCCIGTAPTTQDSSALLHWTKCAGDTRRGIERFIVPKVARHRTKRASRSVLTVLELQEKLGTQEQKRHLDRSSRSLREDTASADTLLRRAFQRDDFIRVRYETIARPSKIFARVQARADAEVAAEGLNSQLTSSSLNAALPHSAPTSPRPRHPAYRQRRLSLE